MVRNDDRDLPEADQEFLRETVSLENKLSDLIPQMTALLSEMRDLVKRAGNGECWFRPPSDSAEESEYCTLCKTMTCYIGGGTKCPWDYRQEIHPDPNFILDSCLREES